MRYQSSNCRVLGITTACLAVLLLGSCSNSKASRPTDNGSIIEQDLGFTPKQLTQISNPSIADTPATVAGFYRTRASNRPVVAPTYVPRAGDDAPKIYKLVGNAEEPADKAVVKAETKAAPVAKPVISADSGVFVLRGNEVADASKVNQEYEAKINELKPLLQPKPLPPVGTEPQEVKAVTN